MDVGRREDGLRNNAIMTSEALRGERGPSLERLVRGLEIIAYALIAPFCFVREHLSNKFTRP